MNVSPPTYSSINVIIINIKKKQDFFLSFKKIFDIHSERELICFSFSQNFKVNQ